MSGICGVIGIENEGLLKRMALLMEHRGDIIEVSVNKGTTIALIRRTDETELYNKGAMSIALDHDIYAIGSQLVEENSEIYRHLVNTSSSRDTIKALRGSFALAVVNTGSRHAKLTLARDIYGTRSMYYLQTRQALFFASEMKCFLALDGFKLEVNPEALEYYLSCGFVSDNQTLLKQVYKVLPGEMVEFENGKLS
ncbi:MAG: hypothetical protein JXB43_03270, partial [Dehalococcoidia bacterium]|nr:hypothetical protein [Dehalococcoidia bacterium]